VTNTRQWQLDMLGRVDEFRRDFKISAERADADEDCVVYRPDLGGDVRVSVTVETPCGARLALVSLWGDDGDVVCIIAWEVWGDRIELDGKFRWLLAA
jgi:hypothetical protein